VNTALLPGESPVERLERLSIPEPNSGCWLFLAGRDSKGYGRLRHAGVIAYAHRLSYETFVAPIPDGLTIDHLCRVHCCINPRHLEAVSNRENILRGTSPTARRAAQTHCSHGHVFDEANTGGKRGHRVCRTCHRLWRRHSQKSDAEAARAEQADQGQVSERVA
jgi:hypothetical protein